MNIDEKPLKFGKYRGKTPDEISDLDQGYIIWMYENIVPKPCSKALYEACQQDAYEDDYERGVDHYFGQDV